MNDFSFFITVSQIVVFLFVCFPLSTGYVKHLKRSDCDFRLGRMISDYDERNMQIITVSTLNRLVLVRGKVRYWYGQISWVEFLVKKLQTYLILYEFFVIIRTREKRDVHTTSSTQLVWFCLKNVFCRIRLQRKTFWGDFHYFTIYKQLWNFGVE